MTNLPMVFRLSGMKRLAFTGEQEMRDVLFAPRGIPMTVLKWAECLECGERVIDAEHRGIIACLNEFISQTEAGDHLGAKAACEKLQALLVSHIESEEGLLRERGFTELDEHIHLHRGLLNQVERLLNRCGAVCRHRPPSACVQTWIRIAVNHFVYGDLAFRALLGNADS